MNDPTRVLVHELDALRFAIRLREQGWQKIETAPKDGTAVLLCGIHDHAPSDAQRGVKAGDTWTAIMLWDVWRGYNEGDCQWVFSKDGARAWSEPTHWMPLPAPPTERR